MKVNSTITRLGVLLLMLLWQQLALAQNQIVVQNVVGEPFCTGSTMAVTFASGGTTTGKFPDGCAGQTFNYTAYIGTYPAGGPITGTQQVHTGTGNFSNLVNANNPRIASTNFNFIIPSTITPAANNYRVQVIVSAACLSTNSADECNNNLTIRPAPTLSSVALSGNSCEGLSSLITLNGLVPSSGAGNLSINYTIDGNPAPDSPLTDASNSSGVATFSLLNQIVNDGKTLAITSITQNYTAAPAGTCATTFSTGNTVNLIVRGTPSITLNSANISGCPGAVADLGFNSTNNSPNRYSIDFDAAANTAGLVDVPLTTVLNIPSLTMDVPIAASVAPGTYNATLLVRVVGVGTGNCLSQPTPITVTVNALPTVSLSNADVCADATELFVPTVSNDVTTYAWMTDAGLFDDTQLANPTLTANSNAGFYGASVTVSNSNSCTASASASVTVNELPVATVDDEEVCAGSTVMLSATVSTGVTLPLSAPSAEAFAWSSAAGTFSPQSATPTLTATAAPGVYTVTLSYTNSNGCTASATASLTINARPTLSTASVTVTVASCANATNGAIAITPSGGDGNYTYSWTRNGSPSFSNATNNPTNLAPGTYNVTVTDGNGCTVTRSIVVGIDPSINIVPVIQNLSCNGDGTGLINLTVNGITPTGYSWTRNGSPFSGGSSISGLSAGTYNVTVTDGFCNVTGSYQVTQPAVLGASLNLVKLACAGNNGIISLTISGGTGPKSYNFSGPTSISPASVSNGTYNFSGLAAGTYNVTVTDANSCETYSSVIVPSSGSTPLNIIFPGSLCNGQSFQLSTNYTGFPGVRYRWAGPSGFSSTSATPTVTLGTATSGVYSVSATITGCTAIVSALTTVTTRGLPNVGNITVVGRTYNTTTNTFSVCRNAPFTFNLVGAAGDNYVWRGPSGSGFSTTTASPSVVVPSATSAQQGQYTISARYAGCTQFNHKVINIQVVSCAIRLATGDFDTESNGIVVKVSPNPVDGVAVVDVSLNSPSAIQLKVLQSGSGKVEYATEAREVQSTHRMEVDMSRMTVGQYLFVVESADGIKTEKVIKVAKKE